MSEDEKRSWPKKFKKWQIMRPVKNLNDTFYRELYEVLTVDAGRLDAMIEKFYNGTYKLEFVNTGIRYIGGMFLFTAKDVPSLGHEKVCLAMSKIVKKKSNLLHFLRRISEACMEREDMGKKLYYEFLIYSIYTKNKSSDWHLIELDDIKKYRYSLHNLVYVAQFAMSYIGDYMLDFIRNAEMQDGRSMILCIYENISTML
jgi:hypothetical protein